jgi:hypothetical protein
LDNPAVFHHKKSSKAEALRFLIVAIAIAVIASFALKYMVKESAQVMMYIQWGIYAVSFGILVFFVIPNFLQKGFFEFYIDSHLLRCRFPDGSGYEVKMADIDKLEKQIRTSTEHWVDYLIIDKEGKSYTVPTQFALSPHRVFVEIRKYLPELKVVKKVNY